MPTVEQSPRCRRALRGIAGSRPAGLEERVIRSIRARRRRLIAEEYNVSNRRREQLARAGFGFEALRKLIAGEEAKTKARRKRRRIRAPRRPKRPERQGLTERFIEGPSSNWAKERR